MITKRLIFALCTAGLLLPAAFDALANDRKTVKMTLLPPRLQTMFDNTKTVCFGRFMIDVPASATTAWGRASVPVTVLVYPNAFGEVRKEARQFIRELESEKAINLNNVPLLISVEDVSRPEGQIVAGYEGFEAIGTLVIRGFFKLNDAGVIVKTRPLLSIKDETTELIRGIARRIRERDETEVPAEPGNCIEYGFLPDESGTPKENPGELIEIGFRLKEFPDTQLSIAIRPAQRKFNESNTLEWQLARLERDLKAEDPNHIRLKTKYLRKGKRTIQNWGEGFEALARSPEQPEIHSIHDFGMDFQGVAKDPLKPFINIQMQTGIADNEAGATKPLLSDAEAIAVWDKITSTIRVRPTGMAAPGTAKTDAQPHTPLGELAATGRTCPQSGTWESSEPSAIEGGQRRYIKDGDIMPRIAVRGEPSLWQKIKGETPSHQFATIWKLVGYDPNPAIVDVAAPMPPFAQGLLDAVSAKSENSTGGDQSEDTPPQGQG